MIKKFQIENFRNISAATLNLTADFNFLIGDNGAGKTSILEAMTFIARGRSFRTKNISHIIKEQRDHFQLVATLDRDVILGMRRSRSEIIVRRNSLPVKKLSTLAKNIPLFLITPNSHELIERGPEYRRKFIDWGLFHVEPGYGEVMQEYRRVLKQRNACLQLSQPQYSVWNSALSRVAEKIDRYRKSYINQITPLFMHTYSRLTGIDSVTLTYKSGWRQGTAFMEQLNEKNEVDVIRGYTSVGPHRADVSIKIDGLIAREILSRGQQKIVVISLILAQASLASKDISPVLLIDDLSSELDAEHQRKLFQLISENYTQTIISSVNADVIDMVDESTVFHVEHGVVRQS